MIEMSDQMKRNKEYENSKYSIAQVRATVAGSNAVKRGNELYLPIPSGMLLLSEGVSQSNRSAAGQASNIHIQDAPWYHSNPAYRSYLQRARFPDLTAIVMRGLVGVASKGEASVKLPSSIAHFEDSATTEGMSLDKLYSYSIQEVLQTSKLVYVLDVKKNNEFVIAVYSAERNVDWEEAVIDGEKVLTSCVFVESDLGDEVEKSIKYELINGVAVYQRYIDGQIDGEEVLIMRQGKTINKLPIFFASTNKNSPSFGIIPLLGPSDIALSIYRKDADLSQAEFMTCNPTLFLFGVPSDETPKLIGSTVTVSVSNPEASAVYPATDTSALAHVLTRIESLYTEAVQAGAAMLNIGGRGAESAEALSIRESASGATLVEITDTVGEAMLDLLNFASDWAGTGEVEYVPSKDFIEKKLTAQELTALVGAWVNDAISHDTLLDKLRDVDIIDGRITNEQEKAKIAVDQENKMSTLIDGAKEDEAE